MAISNFVPQIWSARVKEHLDKALVIAPRANRAWEPDGDSGYVKINQVGDIPVATYSGGSITYATPYSTQTILEFNQNKIAGFKVRDLESIEANLNLVDQYSARLAYSLADDIDRYIASLYTAAGAGDVTVDIAAVAAGEMRTALADAQKLLKMNNAVGQPFLVISPTTESAMFKDTQMLQATDTSDAQLRAGAVGRYMGFDIFVSNNLSGTGVTVTLTGAASAGDTTLTCTLTGDVPANTILTFGAGQYARVTAAAESSETTLTIDALTVDIANSSTATYIKVSKALFGTMDAITWGMNLTPNVEALRDVDSTHDFVRAEQNYGAKVVQPYALGTITVTEVA